MLNFAEQTGSGAVMLVWSFSAICKNLRYLNFMRTATTVHKQKHNIPVYKQDKKAGCRFHFHSFKSSILHLQQQQHQQPHCRHHIISSSNNVVHTCNTTVEDWIGLGLVLIYITNKLVHSTLPQRQRQRQHQQQLSTLLIHH
jgi:hypothetical protein